MSEFNFIKLPEVPKFLDEGLTPATREIGTSLGNIFYAVFSPINYSVEKLRIKHAKNLKKYEEDIQSELNKISEEKLVEPALSIVGPALDASKFYIDEDYMRKMFAKLIASSMNKDSISKSHHSFVEIIKQLSPLDGLNLSDIYKHKELHLFEFYFAEDISPQASYGNSHQQLASIDNLTRLGLISVYRKDPTIELVDHSEYPYSTTPNLELKVSADEFDRDIVLITNFGQDFCDICL